MIAFVFLALFVAVNGDIGFKKCTSLFYKGVQPYQVAGTTQLCKHSVLAVGYDNKMVNPAFSVMYATPAEANSDNGDRLTFSEDADLLTASVPQAPVDSKIFSQGTYDRGHNTPSDIMSYNKTVLKQCYYMSNLAPQWFSFNRGVWAQLEKHVKNWVGSNSPLYIITGVGYKDRNQVKRPFDNIAIPDYFYKVICDPVHANSAGFYGENIDGGGGTTAVFRTVKYIEQNIYGGQLFDSACNTGTVDASKWWTF